jgi:IS1 family transposase
MNVLATDKRARILHCLCEGNSIRATARLADVAINTVVKLLCEAGKACSCYQDEKFRNLKCRFLQTDEAWSFCYAKEKNCTAEMKAKGAGDVWTWAAIDAETKLIPCWFIGSRDASAAYHFMHDLAGRLASRVQLTTDGHRAYLSAVEDAFGAGIDYAMLQKIYGNAPEGPEVRYSPAVCMGTRKAIITGKPDFTHVSTSFVERQNLTLRMSNRRFTRLTNGFSKKLENHEHSISLHFMYYNFCRIHQSLRVTPAMEAGITDHVRTLEEVVALIDNSAQEKQIGKEV